MARILLVDDEQIILDTVGTLLESQGHEVIPVLKGQDAIGMLHNLRHRFDLLLADLRMSPIDGMQLIEIARKFRPSIPIVVVSAYLDDTTTKKVKKLGCVGCVRKPFTVDDVLKAVNDALE
jgi:CheY-like chemotaxis protein